MNDETPTNGDAGGRRLVPLRRERLRPRLPEPLGAAWFALQERVIWPLQDRFTLLGPGPNGRVLIGGGAATLAAIVFVAILVLSSGGGSSPTTTVSEVAAPREPLVTPSTGPAAANPKKKAAPHETLHGAAPVFSPPSPAGEGGKTGKSNSQAAAREAAGEATPPAETGRAGETTSSPASATISSGPGKKPKGDADAAASSTAADGRATVADGPPAGPAALKVAREFAQGFVVYETGGEESAFRDAFKSAATPELAKALLQRPPKQPAGVKVPRAKVLNVVAGPSQGTVYEVSVSLLRVGVTSELRLDMERVKTTGKSAGKSGKQAEWRVTNVLG